MKTSYTVTISYTGFSPELDAAILAQLESRDRRLFDGSGFSFTDGRRELCFYTKREDIAERLRKNLIKAAKAAKYRAKVQVFKNEEDNED